MCVFSQFNWRGRVVQLPMFHVAAAVDLGLFCIPRNHHPGGKGHAMHIELVPTTIKHSAM
jgi:hypothetical protein